MLSSIGFEFEIAPLKTTSEQPLDSAKAKMTLESVSQSKYSYATSATKNFAGAGNHATSPYLVVRKILHVIQRHGADQPGDLALIASDPGRVVKNRNFIGLHGATYDGTTAI
jgi:hypothetical protein